MKTETLAMLVLAALAAFILATIALRLHQGRCHFGGGRLGMNCSYPAAWGAAGAPRRPLSRP